MNVDTRTGTTAVYHPGYSPGFPAYVQGIFNLANIGGIAVEGVASRLSESCAAMYPGAEGWKCAMGVYRMPHVQAPYMMVSSQADSYQLGHDIGHRPDRTDAELAYAATFARRTREGGAGLLAPGSRGAAAGSTVYMMNCYSHATSGRAGFWDMDVRGWRIADALAAFMGIPWGRVLTEPLPAGGLVDGGGVGFAGGVGC